MILLARIRLKVGENEIEVDSRDFYVDNGTLGEVIQDIVQHMPANHARVLQGYPQPDPNQAHDGCGLENLAEAEAYEPEFVEPRPIPADEIPAKLRILETGKFFDSPRTVTETVQRMREYGWATTSLEVSMTLAKMASSRRMSKDFFNNRTRYFAAELVSN